MLQTFLCCFPPSISVHSHQASYSCLFPFSHKQDGLLNIYSPSLGGYQWVNYFLYVLCKLTSYSIMHQAVSLLRCYAFTLSSFPCKHCKYVKEFVQTFTWKALNKILIPSSFLVLLDSGFCILSWMSLHQGWNYPVSWQWCHAFKKIVLLIPINYFTKTETLSIVYIISYRWRYNLNLENNGYLKVKMIR